MPLFHISRLLDTRAPAQPVVAKGEGSRSRRFAQRTRRTAMAGPFARLLLFSLRHCDSDQQAVEQLTNEYEVRQCLAPAAFIINTHNTHSPCANPMRRAPRGRDTQKFAPRRNSTRRTQSITDAASASNGRALDGRLLQFLKSRHRLQFRLRGLRTLRKTGLASWASSNTSHLPPVVLTSLELRTGRSFTYQYLISSTP